MSITLDKNDAFEFTIDKGDDAIERSFRATRELMERIVEAQNLAIKNEIEANAVVINGRKYGMIKDHPGLPPTIFGMKVKTRIDMPDDWDFFIQQTPPMILDNGDRIRSMSNKELSEAIVHTYGSGGVCPPRHTHLYCALDSGCINCWLDWLKSPVEVDDG